MQKPLHLVLTLWSLPVAAVVWLFYILPAWALGYLKFELRQGVLVEFTVVRKKNLHSRLWDGWWGVGLPNALLIHEDGRATSESLSVLRAHEARHCLQWLVLGVFFPFAYFGNSAFIWLFRPNKHAYLDNPFERDARRAAGQRLEIPRQAWPRPGDRWPWW